MWGTKFERVAYDTNTLLKKPSIILEVEANQIIIPYKTLEELDRIKTEINSLRGFQARESVRQMKKIEDKITFELQLNSHFDTNLGYLTNNDDYIINCALRNDAVLISSDYLVQLKCKAKGVQYIDADNLSMDEEHYTGFKRVLMTEKQYKYVEDMVHLGKYPNDHGLVQGQYLIIQNQNKKIQLPNGEEDYEVLNAYVWNGEIYSMLDYKAPSSEMFGHFKPYDIYQKCALDSLCNNQMTMLKGGAGTGKSKMALEYAWNLVMQGKRFNKLICFVNPMASRNSAKLGFYPGTRNEKLLDSAVGSMLASKFGDKFAVEQEITDGKLMLLPFSDIRGFDSTGMKAIIWIVEAQNLDVDLMRLAIQRVGADSKLIIDGDYTHQVDSSYYEGANNGMRRASQVFRGSKFYGEVELPITYRSELAKLAELM